MIAAGQQLEPFVVGNVAAGPMKTMAALLRDPNPIHWDAEVVSRLGLGDKPINQGTINVGYLTEFAVLAAGGIDRVQSISIRFLANVVAGDRVICSGVVDVADERNHTARLSLTAEVGGNPVLSGTATIAVDD